MIGFVNEKMQGVPVHWPPHAETALSLVERRPQKIEDEAHEPAHLLAHAKAPQWFREAARKHLTNFRTLFRIDGFFSVASKEVSMAVALAKKQGVMLKRGSWKAAG